MPVRGQCDKKDKRGDEKCFVEIVEAPWKRASCFV